MLGVEIKERRRLIHPLADYIEIIDVADADPLIEKRFRLWSESGLNGTILLESIDYEASTDLDATTLAKAGIQRLIDYGINTNNYSIENMGPALYRVALSLPGQTVFARSGTFITETEAQNAISQIKRHLSTLFSTEGFCLLENHLLAPPNNTNPDLEIPTLKDPYSFQVTLVFPSGYARDFSDPNGELQQAQPSLYRNKEFRKYTEAQIRKHCPAHIIPRIIWADRATSELPMDPGDPSFDAFEQAFLNWYSLYIIDEVDEAILAPARDALTQITNTLYQEYYSE
jgi:hypothetical protein